jgi:hypothetical protein
MSEVSQLLSSAYEAFEGSEAAEGYYDRHGIESLGVLTVYDDERADLIANHLGEMIDGKIVVEIGAGIGLLACHLAMRARRVYAIEADPTWMSCFVAAIYERKPKNLTYIFGAAEEAPHIAADVALFCTHSGRDAMRKAASRFAPVVIDVYGELLTKSTDPDILRILKLSETATRHGL